MGQTLSSPATKKTTDSGGNDRFHYAISEMQGWRITMEDSHAVVLDLDEDKVERNAFFAVYDGHGGGTVAKFAGENVHKKLLTTDSYPAKEYDAALKRAFLGTDEDIRANPAHARDPSGCTAVAALVTKDKIYVANAGDSRSVLSVKGVVKPLSFDHKPTNESEKTRIAGAGGYVEYGRVNGNLALSRAIGDFEFKKNQNLPPEKQIITSDPDITIHDIDEEDEFLVLACDGIWDCLSSQQVVNFIRLQVSQGKELTEIGEMMCEHCLAPDTSSGAGIGCDNMTVLIVALLHGRTKEEWSAWIKDRVEKQYGYPTPSELPQIYSQSRLMSFRARRDAVEARERAMQDYEDSEQPTFGLGSFARVLGSSGGISFNRENGILTGGQSLMFGGDDSDDDDSGEETTSSFFTETLGLGAAHPEEGDAETGSGSDATQTLKAKLVEFEKGIREDGTIHTDESDIHIHYRVKPLHLLHLKRMVDQFHRSPN
ncbi:PP2C-domain-containing protein [Gymnopus androsaceus JB14]|uniref:protein-serine/threonine phosphatase n=1 Tax=Gymnopus androsaceus JB14 TaxID=1447944 RepID=A0A6A4I3U1_9AGAR|nr:PP2C-domain-containing protein [Gymnopus androsaceus JB14]